MSKPPASYRRIDRLRAIAFACGFTNEDARQFGKLSKTATWEALLELYLVGGESLDTLLDTPLDIEPDIAPEPPDTKGADSACFTRQNSTFLDWVDFGQLIALVLASAGVFVLAMSLWPRINPLNLFPPVRIHIQIGATK